MVDTRIVITGAGGFIGGHLVARLRSTGRPIRAVDIKPLGEWYQAFDDVENVVADLKLRQEARQACAGASEVYQLAADMGGMGFIEHHKALCMLSVLTNTHLLMGALEAGASRFFYSSSACVYAADKQTSADVTPLKESDAYPAMAERKLAEIGAELREKFGVERVAIHHRIGVLAIGEASVAIAVATPHRREAFEACQYAIDRLKQTVPIWKKEVWSDGEQWIGWEHDQTADPRPPAAV